MNPRLQQNLRSVWLAPVLAISLSVAWCAGSAHAQALVWEFTPYRVQIKIALADAPEFTDRFATELEQAVTFALDSPLPEAADLTEDVYA